MNREEAELDVTEVLMRRAHLSDSESKDICALAEVLIWMLDEQDKSDTTELLKSVPGQV